MINTVLFDLDGTLVPLVQDEFIQAYFTTLVRHMVPLGFDGEKLTRAVWRGTSAMVENGGAMTNRQLFWDSFTRDMGIQALSLESHLEDFYLTDFDNVRGILKENVDRGPLVRSLRERGYRVILATTPIFPRTAIETRLRWVGLTGEDFEWVTSYENCRHSKPNPDYYRDILQARNLQAAHCLMVGNNPIEDMAALQLGLNVWLVTDYLENPQGVSIDGYSHGTFAETEKMLLELPNLA